MSMHWWPTRVLVLGALACAPPAQTDHVSDVPDAVAAPSWLKARIAAIASRPPENPPIRITRWRYQDQVVYFIPAYCCDVMSELLDEDGRALCAPDGGMTGEGDGRCHDFYRARTGEEVIWADQRSQNP